MNQTDFFLIMAGAAFLSSLGFMLLKKP